jgi:hypothetical protein
MGKIVRIFIAIVVILSFIVIARYDPAAASNLGSSDQTVQGQAELSAPLADDDCNDKKNQNKDNCKCKNDNGKGKKDCGTVKPPDDDDKICDEEGRSVGGVVVVDVKKKKDKECVGASTRPHDPAVDQLPPGSGTILSDVLSLTIPASKTKVKICFAAPPLKKKLKIFSSSTGTWITIKTNVNKGQACAEVPGSGKYVLVAQ